MGKESGDVAAQLDAVIDEAAETDSPAVETEVEQPEDKKGTSHEGKNKAVKAVPYTRFKEVNDEKKALEEKFTDLQAKHDETTSSLTKLTQMLDSLKEDADLVKEIRALQNDPKMLPHIEAIDKKIRGIEEEFEEEIEEKGKVSDKTIDKATRVLAKEQEKLQDQLSQQRSDILLQRADAIAEKWLSALPEQYTEEDRNIIAELWANKVDWDEVETNPKGLMEVLNKTFQDTVTVFGRPRGGLIDPADPESYEIEEVAEPTKSPEDELQEIIKGKNFGGVKEVSVGGRKTIQPEVSEEDFASVMAGVMKRGNR